MYSIIGLALVILGWVIQLHRLAVQKKPGLSPFFLLIYAAGAAVLTAGAFLVDDMTTGILNLVCIILPATVLGLVIGRANTADTPAQPNHRDDSGRPVRPGGPGRPTGPSSPENPRVITNPRPPTNRVNPRNPRGPNISRN
jgi:hypothetical protein